MPWARGPLRWLLESCFSKTWQTGLQRWDTTWPLPISHPSGLNRGLQLDMEERDSNHSSQDKDISHWDHFCWFHLLRAGGGSGGRRGWACAVWSPRWEKQKRSQAVNLPLWECDAIAAISLIELTLSKSMKHIFSWDWGGTCPPVPVINQRALFLRLYLPFNAVVLAHVYCC